MKIKNNINIVVTKSVTQSYICVKHNKEFISMGNKYSKKKQT